MISDHPWKGLSHAVITGGATRMNCIVVSEGDTTIQFMRVAPPVLWYYSSESTMRNIHDIQKSNYFCINHGDQGFFQFEIIINVLDSSFRFIRIPMLWVYCNYKYFYSYSVGIDFRRQNLASTDVRFWRLKSIPAL